jgi:hypothetical protein
MTLLLLLLLPACLWQDVVGRPRREHSRLHTPLPQCDLGERQLQWG